MHGLWDSPDLTAVVRVAARNAPSLDRWRGRLAPARVPLQAARRHPRPQHAHAQPPRHRRPLRPRQRVLRADARRDDDVLVGLLPAPRHDARAGLDAPSSSSCVASSISRPERPRAGDRHGLGRFRRPRRENAWLPRHHHDDLARAVRARPRARGAAGVGDRVRCCARTIATCAGRYDKLVSIEMIEAVGWRDFDTFFAALLGAARATTAGCCCRRSSIDDRAYEVEKASRSFIRTHIFPNGCLPSLEVIARCVARLTDMRTVGLEDLTPHYAETLRRWRANFEAAAAAPRGARLRRALPRLWRMYLSYCEAGFAERRIGLVQLLLAKPGWRRYAGVTSAHEAPRALA